MKTLLCVFCCIFSTLWGAVSEEKILICGVCKNVASSIENTIQNAEKLGGFFKDYAVIIYENNSFDKTVGLFSEWAKKNPHVVFITERVKEKDLPASRTEKIARARNIVLAHAKDSQYADFSYLVMVDLDFSHPWPIERIIQTIEGPNDWDCVTANGVNQKGEYYDRYALRNERFPFGPEILDTWWWKEAADIKLFFSEKEKRASAYSAFGGLAIYKTKSILPFSYSGIVTEDLKRYYKKIIADLSPKQGGLGRLLVKKNSHLAQMKSPLTFVENTRNEHPVRYPYVTCSEHVPLHASMAMHGFGKIYIDPQMVLKAY